MFRTQHRFITMLAATSAALALGAAPAFAGSDGCSGGDCQDENTPARVVPVVPTPVAPAPLLGSGGGDLASEHASKAPSTRHASRTRHVVRRTRTRAVTVAQRTIPRGAVAAGAGGTAPQRPDGLLVGLGGAALVLLAAGGGMVASGRSPRP
jgi:hypothetical protein